MYGEESKDKMGLGDRDTWVGSKAQRFQWRSRGQWDNNQRLLKWSRSRWPQEPGSGIEHLRLSRGGDDRI